jgi:hypothetical protein
MTMGGQDVTRMMPRDGNKGGHREDLRFEYQTRRDAVLFERGWFADFRSRWQADLFRERLNFRARLEAI